MSATVFSFLLKLLLFLDLSWIADPSVVLQIKVGTETMTKVVGEETSEGRSVVGIHGSLRICDTSNDKQRQATPFKSGKPFKLIWMSWKSQQSQTPNIVLDAVFLFFTAAQKAGAKCYFIKKTQVCMEAMSIALCKGQVAF